LVHKGTGARVQAFPSHIKYNSSGLKCTPASTSLFPRGPRFAGESMRYIWRAAKEMAAYVYDFFCVGRLAEYKNCCVGKVYGSRRPDILNAVPEGNKPHESLPPIEVWFC